MKRWAKWAVVGAAMLLLASVVFRGRPADFAVRLIFPRSHFAKLDGLRTSEGGLQQYMVQVYFRASPAEIRAALAESGFTRDDERLRYFGTTEEDFKELAGFAIPEGALGFAKSRHLVPAGTFCRVICPADFSFVYAVQVDFGKN